jgi:hypothetical protein
LLRAPHVDLRSLQIEYVVHVQFGGAGSLREVTCQRWQPSPRPCHQVNAIPKQVASTTVTVDTVYRVPNVNIIDSMPLDRCHRTRHDC